MVSSGSVRGTPDTILSRWSFTETGGGGAMRDFVEFVARHLVDRPEEVAVEAEERENKLVFRIKVSQLDVGKIIGKNGRTASALRVLLRAVAAKEGKRAVLDIIG
jgi:hypothetical protein